VTGAALLVFSIACGSSDDTGHGADSDSDSDGETDADTGDGSDTATGTGTGTGLPDGCESDWTTAPTEPVRLNQIFFDFTDDFVELRNRGSADQPLTGWALATRSDRVYRFAAGLTVAAGSCVTLYWRADADCRLDAEACGVGGFVNDLVAAGGDLFLLRADDVDCPLAAVDYVRWGVEPEVDSLEEVAALADEWPLGESVDASELPDGAALQHDGGDGNGAGHWAVEPTPVRCE
jgi:hypothetical protein